MKQQVYRKYYDTKEQKINGINKNVEKTVRINKAKEEFMMYHHKNSQKTKKRK